MATLSRTKVAENGTIKAGADIEKDQKLSPGGQKRDCGGTRSKRVQSEHWGAPDGCCGARLGGPFLQEDTSLAECGCACFTI